MRFDTLIWFGDFAFRRSFSNRHIRMYRILNTIHCCISDIVCFTNMGNDKLFQYHWDIIWCREKNKIFSRNNLIHLFDFENHLQVL